MLNFGLCELRLVDPSCDPMGEEAVRIACGATPLLEACKTYATVREAVEDCGVVFATTARPRDIALPVFSARVAAQRAAASCASGSRAALLFGCEKNGLAHAELRHANAIVTIPTDPLFYSLNLAQAVLLLAYECQLSREAIEEEAAAEEGGETAFAGGEEEDGGGQEAAAAGQLASLFDFWEDALWRSRFFGLGGADAVQEKLRAGAAMDKLRALLQRSAPSAAEARLLRGAMQALVEPKAPRAK